MFWEPLSDKLAHVHWAWHMHDTRMQVQVSAQSATASWKRTWRLVVEGLVAIAPSIMAAVVAVAVSALVIDFAVVDY